MVGQWLAKVSSDWLVWKSVRPIYIETNSINDCSVQKDAGAVWLIWQLASNTVKWWLTAKGILKSQSKTQSFSGNTAQAKVVAKVMSSCRRCTCSLYVNSCIKNKNTHHCCLQGQLCDHHLWFWLSRNLGFAESLEKYIMINDVMSYSQKMDVT